MNRDRRTDIIIQAGRTFLELGYDATSMNLVAERCRVTKPGLYYHFDGKQALLFAIMSLAMDELESHTEHATAGLSDPRAYLRGFIETHARLISTRPEGSFAILVIDLTQSLRPEDQEVIAQRKREYIEQLERAIERVWSAEGMPGLDSTVTAFTLLGMVLWMSKWFDPSGRLSGEEVAQQVTELAMSSVLGADLPVRDAGPIALP